MNEDWLDIGMRFAGGFMIAVLSLAVIIGVIYMYYDIKEYLKKESEDKE